MRNKLALMTLIVIAVLAGTAANTDRRLTGAYMNAKFYSGTASDTVRYMKSTGVGDTTAVAARRPARFWSFAHSGGVADCSLGIYSAAIPGWNGDFTDTSATNRAYVILNVGDTWNSEGLQIYGFQFKTGTNLQVIARD